jgi:hypothetical protein
VRLSTLPVVAMRRCWESSVARADGVPIDLRHGREALPTDPLHSELLGRKFRQQAVAGVFYNTAPVFVYLWINQLPEMRFEALPSDLATGDYVVVTVSDNGSGMSETTLARVFEPFFRTKDADPDCAANPCTIDKPRPEPRSARRLAASRGGYRCSRRRRRRERAFTSHRSMAEVIAKKQQQPDT